MSRLTPIERFLMNLEKRISPNRREYLSVEAALAGLKELTGQDFGLDAEKWREWLKSHPL